MRPPSTASERLELLNESDIASTIAEAFGADIQTPVRGIIQLAADGSNPLEEREPYKIPVKIQGQSEIYHARFDPTWLASNRAGLAGGTTVWLVVNDEGEYEIDKVDAFSTAQSYVSMRATPQVDHSGDTHDHTGGAQGVQLNASTVFNTGFVPMSRGGTGTNLGALASGSILMRTGSGVNATIGALTVIERAIPFGASNGLGWISPGFAGNVLQSNGLNWESVTPNFSASTITSGILPYARGGTGTNFSLVTNGALVVKSGSQLAAANLTAGALIVGNGTSPPLALASGSAGEFVRSTGTSWTSAAIQSGDLAAALASPPDIGGTAAGAIRALTLQINPNDMTSIRFLSTIPNIVQAGTFGAHFDFYRSEGTVAVPLPLTTPTNLAVSHYRGRHSSGWLAGARLAVNSTEAWATGGAGSRIVFGTCENGTTALTDRVWVDHDGVLLADYGLRVNRDLGGSAGTVTLTDVSGGQSGVPSFSPAPAGWWNVWIGTQRRFIPYW